MFLEYLPSRRSHVDHNALFTFIRKWICGHGILQLWVRMPIFFTSRGEGEEDVIWTIVAAECSAADKDQLNKTISSISKMCKMVHPWGLITECPRD